MTAPNSKSAKRRVFDGFTFFNELDVLEIRLRETSHLVDAFILVEAPRTFTDKPKPLHYHENRPRFAAWADKIVHVVVDDLPATPATAWDREHFQRRAIRCGFDLAGATPDDFVMISDVDEIPKPDLLARALADPESPRRLTFFESELYLYFLNMRLADGLEYAVPGPRLLLRRFADDPQAVRGSRPRKSRKAWLGPAALAHTRINYWQKLGAALMPHLVPRAAWHFSFLGGVESIRAKLSSYSHQEFASAERLDAAGIAETLASGRFIFDDNVAMKTVPIDDSYPKSVTSNLDHWRHVIAPLRQT
jgi:beta-1,4-mannosyl-glycoprotein beta-1,4-N-acetylglucosaminyltransferase